MWHEARRQERKIRGMLVDYRRRAERRRDFYEKIKADPTQFLQIHGRQCKIHLDPAVAAAADSAVMMPWQGQTDNLIDRFDVRAHLDYIPPVKKEEEPEVTAEERQLNYERYRIIAQNSFLGITEEKFLKQLHLEEQYGYTEMKIKKEQRTGGTAIGFNYEEGTAIGPTPQQPVENTDDESVDDSDSDLDVDLAINVSKMDPTQAHEMNKHGRSFGMSSNDFYSFLTNDLEEAETYRQAKEEEHEKALFSGRKSRRERRAHREKRLANRVISPPSYAARTSPTYPIFRESKSLSKSPSPENTGKITYITSFGGEDEAPSSSKPTYADKVKYGKNKSKAQDKSDRNLKRSRSRSRERTYSRLKRKSLSPRRKTRRSRSKSRRSRSYSRSRRSRSSRSRRSRSRSKSYKRSRSRSRSRYDKGRSGNYGKSYRSRKSSTSSSSSSSSSLSSKSSRSITPKKRHSSTSSSRSKSPVPVKSKSKSPVKESPPKILTRYYGRKKSDQSSSDLSESSVVEDIEMKPAVNTASSDTKFGYGNNSGTPIKKITAKMTIQERLKRKRQALLNKQYRADKIAEQLKTEREKQEQQTREDELREMAIKLRRRQREKRHAYDSNRSSSTSDTDTNSKGRTSSTERRRQSRSPSPRRRSRDRDSRKRDVRRNSREHSRERDRRARSRDQRDRSTERRYQRKRESPTIRRSPLRYEINRENDRKDRWRDDRDERDNKQKHKSLVDY